MSIMSKHIPTFAVAAFCSVQLVHAQNYTMTPELSISKGLSGATVKVGTGCIMPTKKTVDHYDVLVDGKMVASSPSHPAPHECSIPTGFGLSAPTFQVSFDPVSVKIEGTPGPHNVTLVFHYTDSTQDGSTRPNVFMISTPRPALNQVYTPPWLPASNTVVNPPAVTNQPAVTNPPPRRSEESFVIQRLNKPLPQ
jgi:hypothetical protein